MKPRILIVDDQPELTRMLRLVLETTGEYDVREMSRPRREREIVQLLAEGRTTKEVADTLGISVKTAETHRNSLMGKLKIHNVAQLVLYAVRNGIVEA